MLEDTNMDKVKQVIVMRKDLNLSKGRLVTQGAHASIAFLTDLIKEYNPLQLTDSQLQLNEAQKEWIYGTFYKVCLSVDSEKELLDIGYNAVMLGVSVKYIEETNGFDKPIITCLAIGPDYSSKIDPVTKHLKLL
jgi:PTH2 family peptidyl-tRNA hydrolase